VNGATPLLYPVVDEERTGGTTSPGFTWKMAIEMEIMAVAVFYFEA